MVTYVLVDSSQRVGFHRRLDDRKVRYCSLFDGQAEQKHPEIAPLLLHWPEDESVNARQMRRDIRSLASEKPAVSIIESDMAMEELSEHLRKFHLVKLPNGREMLLRWYDTRILPVWVDIMAPSQAQGFFSGVNRWRMYDRYGEEVDLTIQVKEARELPALSPYAIDEAQYARLIEACGADVLIAHLRDVIPDEIRRLSHRVLYPFVTDHLDAARRQGLESLDDQTQYMLLALYTSGEFLSHPHVRQRLDSNAEDHDEDFSTWAMQVPDEVFALGEPLWSAVQTS